MRKTIVTFLVGLISLTLQAQVPTNGLVAYYPFNGNANDESGNGNDGIVNGATLTQDRNNKENSAYFFDGKNDYILVKNSNSLSGLKEITMSIWFQIHQWQPDNGKNWSALMGKMDLDGHYYEWRIQPTQNKIYACSFSGNGSSINSYIENSKWTSLIVVIKDNEFSYYINGQLIGKDEGGSQGSVFSQNIPLLIGVDPPGVTEYTNGVIDDIRIYNRALEESEVVSLYREGKEIDDFPPAVKVENSYLANISPSEVASNANVFYYYTLKDTEGHPIEGLCAVVAVNGTEIVGEPSDKMGVSVVTVPVYGKKITDTTDDIIAIGSSGEIKVSHITDPTHSHKIPLTSDTQLTAQRLFVRSAWMPSDLNLKIRGGVGAEAGIGWAKIKGSVDLSMGLKLKFLENKIDKIKYKGGVEGKVGANLNTGKVVSSAKMGVTLSGVAGASAEFEMKNRFEAYILLIRELMLKNGDNNGSDEKKILAVQLLDKLCESRGIVLDKKALFVKSATGYYYGASGELETEIFKKGKETKFRVGGKEKNLHFKFSGLSLQGKAGFVYSTTRETDYATGVISNVTGTEIDLSGKIGVGFDINTRWMHVNKWKNLTYPLKLNNIGSKFIFKKASGNVSRGLKFGISVSRDHVDNRCNQLESTFEDKLSIDAGVSGALGDWLHTVKDKAGIGAEITGYRKNVCTLQSSGRLASFLSETPSVSQGLFPMQSNRWDVSKQYDVLTGKIGLPTGLHDIANPPASYSDMGIDRDLTYEEENNYGIEFYAKYPVYSVKIASIFVEGGLSFDATFPRLKQYYERKSGKMFTSFLYPPVEGDDSGNVLKNAIETLANEVKASFRNNNKEVQDALNYVNNNQSLVGTGANNMTFTNQHLIRKFSRTLTNYQKIKANTTKRRSIIKFEIPAIALNKGDSVSFGYFYTGGDLVCGTYSKDTITAVSDVFNLMMFDTERVQSNEFSKGEMEVTTWAAKEDLQLIGFEENTPVHLYYKAIDDLEWTDLGLAIDGVAVKMNKLGYYFLGTSIKSDKEPPIISANIDMENKQIIIDIDENLALSSDKVVAYYNGIQRKVVLLENNRYLLNLTDEDMRKNGVLIVNATDVAGNLGVLEKEFKIVSSVDLESIDTIDGFSLSPNPATSKVVVKAVEHLIGEQIEVVDMKGKIVETEQVNGRYTNLDISQYAKGAYFVRIGKIVRKLIVN